MTPLVRIMDLLVIQWIILMTSRIILMDPLIPRVIMDYLSQRSLMEGPVDQEDLAADQVHTEVDLGLPILNLVHIAVDLDHTGVDLDFPVGDLVLMTVDLDLPVVDLVLMAVDPMTKSLH